MSLQDRLKPRSEEEVSHLLNKGEATKTDDGENLANMLSTVNLEKSETKKEDDKSAEKADSNESSKESSKEESKEEPEESKEEKKSNDSKESEKPVSESSEDKENTRLITSSYEVAVKLADLQADPNSPLYSVKRFEDLGL